MPRPGSIYNYPLPPNDFEVSGPSGPIRPVSVVVGLSGHFLIPPLLLGTGLFQPVAEFRVPTSAEYSIALPLVSDSHTYDTDGRSQPIYSKIFVAALADSAADVALPLQELP